MKTQSTRRRDFIKSAGTASVAAALASSSLLTGCSTARPRAAITTRPLTDSEKLKYRRYLTHEERRCSPGWFASFSASDPQGREKMFPQAIQDEGYSWHVGDCYMVNGHLTFNRNGTAVFRSKVKTFHTHRYDQWKQDFLVIHDNDTPFYIWTCESNHMHPEDGEIDFKKEDFVFDVNLFDAINKVIWVGCA